MSFKIDPYLTKTFDAKHYNCWHFVCDVWREVTGVDLGDQTPENRSAVSYTNAALNFAASLRQLPEVKDPCIVLMLRKRSQPHIGVYYKGRILHLSAQGAQYRPVNQVTADYSTVQYYQ